MVLHPMTEETTTQSVEQPDPPKKGSDFMHEVVSEAKRPGLSKRKCGRPSKAIAERRTIKIRFRASSNDLRIIAGLKCLTGIRKTTDLMRALLSCKDGQRWDTENDWTLLVLDSLMKHLEYLEILEEGFVWNRKRIQKMRVKVRLAKMLMQLVEVLDVRDLSNSDKKIERVWVYFSGVESEMLKARYGDNLAGHIRSVLRRSSFQKVRRQLAKPTAKAIQECSRELTVRILDGTSNLEHLGAEGLWHRLNGVLDKAIGELRRSRK